MVHDDLPLEPIEHFQCFPVFRVLFGNDSPWTEEVLPGDRHPYQEGPNTGEDFREIFEETVHSLLKMPTH